MRRGILVFASLLVLSACGSDEDPVQPKPKVFVNPAPDGAAWPTLEEWKLFSDATSQEPSQRVEPYDVISPLWSDGTFKRRFIHLPDEKTIDYASEGPWGFPVGTVLVKTFSYLHDAREPSLGERLLETRLLVHEASGWVGHTYVWNEEQTNAERKVAGADIAVSFIDAAGESQSLSYSVPNTNLCNECHGKDEPNTLGGVTRQLDREYSYAGKSKNQIDYLASLGWFTSEPEPGDQRQRMVDPEGVASVEERARAYMDANCAHCHDTDRVAAPSGLFLSWAETKPGADPKNFGVCKVPTSAGGGTCGLVHDVVPGDPASSILICRVKSREPQVQMPPLATKRVHPAGVTLLEQWVSGLSGACQ